MPSGKKTRGFAFEPDSPEQHDFEARFPYVETEDQLACIDEIKHDMEQERPMERLLCGDVGFGKIRGGSPCGNEMRHERETVCHSGADYCARHAALSDGSPPV